MSARKTLPLGTPAAGRRPRSAPSRSAWSLGFTLIELMVVVLIITVMAGIAAPSVVVQLKDRRVQEAARKIALLYREARLQAVGQGAGVLIRFNAGTFTVLEAVEGPGAACEAAPVASCLGRPWNSDPTLSRQSATYTPAGNGDDLDAMTVAFKDADDNALSAFEVCFSPNGRAFSRAILDDGTPLLPLTQALLGTLQRPGRGRSRSVVLLPNGTARLSTQ
ncbi:MAG: hypothetical protein RL033_2928 [Pseudomonadota bacterium]|jgi:type II secretion system protein H